MEHYWLRGPLDVVVLADEAIDCQLDSCNGSELTFFHSGGLFFVHLGGHVESGDHSALRWGQRQRFEFLEKRLYWEGTLTRGDLMDRFGISAPQATADLTRYAELAPGNIEFDRSRKVFVSLSTFVPRFFEPSARNYLTQLLLQADEAVPPHELWIGKEISNAAIPRVRRRMEVEILRPVVNAIHQRRQVEVHYQSMTRPEPHWRSIAPHALVFDGARWHARCWCYTRSRFADFVLARMLSVRESTPSGIDPSLDAAWHQEFEMKLAPYPGLPEGQRRAIEMDFNMIDGRIGIPMRLCLTGYFERHYGLDIPREALPEWRRQIILENRDELLAMRSEFGELAGPA